MNARRCVVSALVFPTALLAVSYAVALDRGSRAPAIQATDLAGHAVSLADARGKVVLVDFWASWCGPCAEAMPAIDRIYRRYREHGLVVVGVSVDDSEARARGFLRRTRVSFPIVHDRDHAVAGRYSPPTMPSTFVIDRRGVVRHVHAGFRDGDAARLEALVRELL